MMSDHGEKSNSLKHRFLPHPRANPLLEYGTGNSLNTCSIVFEYKLPSHKTGRVRAPFTTLPVILSCHSSTQAIY